MPDVAGLPTRLIGGVNFRQRRQLQLEEPGKLLTELVIGRLVTNMIGKNLYTYIVPFERTGQVRVAMVRASKSHRISVAIWPYRKPKLDNDVLIHWVSILMRKV